MIRIFFLLNSVVLLLFLFKCVNCMTMCTSMCPDEPIVYDELHCRPNRPSNWCQCPQSYSCPNYTTFNRNKCYYNGHIYRPGQNLTTNLGSLCDVDCFCDNSGDIAKFTCKKAICKEYLIRPGGPCVFQRSLTECCATNIICDPTDIKNLPTCIYDGQIYRKGEFITSATMADYRCICNEQFDASIPFSYNSNCARIPCGIQLYSLNQFQMGCVPIYDEYNSVCPSEQFKCPSSTDIIIRAAPLDTCAKAPKQSKKSKCQFGALHLNIGDSLNNDNDPCIECTCQIPPFITCSRRAGC